MPTKTFLNLKEEKKTKLISASMREFTEKSYYDASINSIINKAGIPRGSFYMYFKDKEDLFLYLITFSEDKLTKIFLNNLKKENGDIRESFIHIFDDLAIRIKKFRMGEFFRNIFLFLKIKEEKLTPPVKKLYNSLKDEISISNIEEENEEFIFSIFFHNLFTSLSQILNNEDIKQVREEYIKKIDILCYGIYKDKED